MNPETIFAHYLNKYQISLKHPDHGLIILTSARWSAHPELQITIQQALAGLKGVQTVTPPSATQLTLHYDSAQLRQLNPLSLLKLERQISRDYHRADD